jgi:hypothetical protein
MKTGAKLALGCFGVTALGICLLVALIIFAARGFDASKKDPRELFMSYVAKRIPASVTVQGAVGQVRPLTGMGITFRFTIGQKDLDDLIAAKRLQKTEPFELTADESPVLKHPEFYRADRDPDWSGASGIRLVVDRDAGIAFYSVFSI